MKQPGCFAFDGLVLLHAFDFDASRGERAFQLEDSGVDEPGRAGDGSVVLFIALNDQDREHPRWRGRANRGR